MDLKPNKHKKKSIELDWDLAQELLFIKKGNTLHQVKLNEVLFLSSEGNYVTLNTQQGKFVIKISLKRIRTFFPGNRFVQIHRSFIVQLRYIEKIDLSTNELFLQGQVLPLGRKFKSQLLDQLNLIQ